MTMFSEADREAISKAVRGAEGHTSGEIVPFITKRSSRYAAAAWRAAAVFAAIGSIAAWAVQSIQGSWHASWVDQAAFVHVVAGLAATAGFSLARWSPPFVRLFAGRRTIDAAVHRRAMQAFVEEEVFNTKDRTGILLFVSLLEHRIEVFGDAGINALVTADDWVEVVALVRDGIRRGRPVEGLVGAIGRCGSLLREKGVAVQRDDTNELSDSLRLDKGN